MTVMIIKQLNKALVNLLSTVIEWNLVDGDKVDKEGVWNASSIIADASIDGPICTYSYSNKMRKLLYRPELYGRLNMVVQAKFQSTYGLALYENCIRYQNIGQTPWFDIAKFRKLMGVEEGKYKIFRDLKSRVFDKAVEEVNKYSPIFVVPQLRKQGRQVIAIQFLIKKSHIQESHASEKYTNIDEHLKEEFGLSKKQINDVLSLYDLEYVKQKIAIIESSPSFINGKIGNLAKYLLSALKEDYQPTKKSHEVVTQLRSDRYEKENQKRDEQNKKDKERQKHNKKLIEFFKQLPIKEKTPILNNFIKFIDKGIYAEIYHRDGLENILIQDQLCYFLKKNDYVFQELKGEIVE